MKPLTLISTSAAVLLFDRRSGTLHRYTDDAADVLRALVDTPAHALGRDDAHEFYEVLFAAGCFDGSGRLNARVVDAFDVTPPITLHVEVSGVCNLRCAHCFAVPLPRTGVVPLSREELRALFADAAALGTCRVSLTGGEPLMRRDILGIIDDAAEAGLAPSIVTNGLVHDAVMASSLAQRLGDRRLLWLSVSLDGATARTNDRVRGDGVFERVVARLSVLRDAGVEFALAFTVHSGIIDEIDACVALAHDVGAATAVFRPLYPTGAALSQPQLMPTLAAWLQAKERVVRAGGSVEDDDDVSVYPRGACAAGNTQASVSLDGTMSPCGFLGAAYDGPNVRDVSLSTAWRQARAFTTMREASDFDGGCRVRALAEAGSAHARDPWRMQLPIIQQ